jgi:hypothetical protein
MGNNELESPATGEEGVPGDMPRGSQFGYLFKSGQGEETLNRTVAHELAHGRFKLRHTFDSDYGKLVTDNNLMDYSGGVHLAKWQWDMLFDPALLVSPFEGDEKGMLQSDIYTAQSITNPRKNRDITHRDAILIQNSDNQTIAFTLPDETIFVWVDNATANGYFKSTANNFSYKNSYMGYCEDKYNRETQPISWGIYLAAYDIGQFAIDFGTSPLETTSNFAKGIWKIATLDFDIAKTWDRIINADLTDASYVVSTVLMCQLAGPKGKKLVAEKDMPRFGEFLEETATITASGGGKLTWAEVVVLFQKARTFETSISQYLLKLYPVEKGYHAVRQVYLKVDGVTSIADDLIYNTNTRQFILNETKYGASNTLRKNQKNTARCN